MVQQLSPQDQDQLYPSSQAEAAMKALLERLRERGINPKQL